MSISNSSFTDYIDNVTRPYPIEELGIGSNKQPQADQFVSDHVRDLVTYLTFVGLCNAISLCGVAANILNMLVYWKQGFEESINVSFFSLSLCDLIVVTLFLWAGVCLAPGFARHSDTTALVSELHLVVGGSQRMTFIRLSVWITAFIAIERCVSIMRPHKVKVYFTRARSALAITAMFVLVSASALPVYSSVQVKNTSSKMSNSSRLRLTFTSSHSHNRNISVVLAAVVQVLSLLAVLISNAILLASYTRRTHQWETNTVPSSSSVVRSSNSSRYQSMNRRRTCATWWLTSKQRVMPQIQEAVEPEHGNQTTNCRNSITDKNLLFVTLASIPLDPNTPTCSNTATTTTVTSLHTYRTSNEHENSDSTAYSTKADDPKHNKPSPSSWMQKPRLNLSSRSTAVGQKKKLAKMILILSVMALASSIPNIIMFLIVSVDNRFGLRSRYGNLTRIISGLVAVLETLNATLNIIVFYRMSSRYRQTLQKVLKWRNGTNRVAPALGNPQASFGHRRY